jgi:hypothetical protein
MYLMRIKDLNRALEQMKPTDKYAQFILSLVMGLILCGVIVFLGLFTYVVVPIIVFTILSSMCLLRYQNMKEIRERFLQSFVDDLNNADANRLRWKYKKPRKGRDGSMKGESIEIKILIRIPEPFSLPEHVIRGAQRSVDTPEYDPADYTRPPPGDPRLPPGERLLSPLESNHISVLLVLMFSNGNNCGYARHH